MIPDPPLYQQMTGEMLFDPIDAAGPEPGSTDHLVERTDNSLRPEDLALPQPPQDPEWRPDGDG